MALTQNFALSASQTSTLRARGLYTLQNYLSEIPEGALLNCNNIVIDRDGVVGQRRGFNFYGTSMGVLSTTAKQLLTYKGIILRHYQSTLDYDSDGLGDFVTLATDILEPETGLRIRYAESNGNLYFTSNLGIQKISSTGEIGLTNPVVTLAGGIAATDGVAYLNPTPGWFLQDSQVAYRIVWGYTDANGNVILGAPSDRIVITNPASSLTVTNFNALLTQLQQVAAADPSQPFYNNNFSSLVLPANASSTQIYDALLVLASGPSNLLDQALTETMTGNITSGSNLVTGLSNTQYLDLGMVVTDSTGSLITTGTLTVSSTTISSIPSTTGIFPGDTVTDGSVTQTLVGNIVSGSNQITGLTTTTGLVIGMPITDATVGTNIPTPTYITAINTVSNIITMSNAAAVTATADSITFTSNLVPGTTVVSITDSNDLVISNAATSTVTSDNLIFTADIPPGTTVIAINSPTSVTLSNNATKTITADTLIFNSVLFQDIVAPTAPLNPGTSQDYVNMQTYFDSIINELNITNGISDTGKAAIGGAFNQANTTATVDLYFSVPQGITIAYFYQVYRSDMATSTGASLVTDVTADDEMKLIFEGNPTAAQITAEVVHFYDNVPESYRVNGINLYTNGISGEGIAQENLPPPFATDLALYSGSMFYSDCKTLQQVNLSLLGATGLAGTKFEILINGTITSYTFVTPVSQQVSFNCIAGSLFTSSGTSDYFDIFNTENVLDYRVWFNVGTVTPPSNAGGQILVECAILNSDTVDQVASKLQIALNGLGNDFIATDTSPPAVVVTNQNPGISNTPVLHVANPGFTVTVITSGNGENAATKQVTASTAPTPSQEIQETATSLVRIINETNGSLITASYLSGPTDIPGLMSFQTNSYLTPAFNLGISNGILGSNLFSASLPQISIGTLTNSSTTISGLPTNSTSTLTLGQPVSATYLPLGTTLVSITDGQTVVVSNSAALPFPLTTITEPIIFGMPLTSSSNVNINRLYYSKTQQPEAVPLLNYIDIGSRDKRIVRILALRTSLYVLKEDGVFQVTGTDPTTFSVNLFDDTARIIGQDSAVTLNNQIYMFSNQGVTSVSDTGISVVSRPIENLLIPLTNNPNFTAATFGVSYESDRAYLIWVPSNNTDTIATQCFRWNTFTNTWVKWDIEKTCGVVVPETLRLFVGAGDVNYIEEERKNFDRTDYSDRSYSLSIAPNQVFNLGSTFAFGTLNGAVAGDVYVQTQYLTIPQFNRLLVKLDEDPGITTKNYFSTLQALPGLNLRTQLTLLANKLDAEPGLSGGYSAAISGFGSQFIDMQNAFNIIIGLLNADSGIAYRNFINSTGTESWEVQVSSVNAMTLQTTLAFAQPWIQGPIILYTAISTEAQWAPIAFGDPALIKRVREGTFIFENKAFTGATVSYASDLSTGYVSVPFLAEGVGTWGSFPWGENVVWGGDGSQVPLRTLIPAFKQRCRYISSQYAHSTAREQYLLYGFSYAYEVISTRGYR